jgi:D-sedoheptulose 7-phosphate isomerase
LISDVLDEHAEVLAATRELIPEAEAIAEVWIAALRAGGTILFCGNGGSATDADHLATELVGRFEQNRPAFRAMSLATSPGTLTAVGNDYGFDAVFERQVEAHADARSVLVAISTSGNSPSILRAAVAARQRGATVVGFTGRTGGGLLPLCDRCLRIPADRTARIQEMHLLLGHAICGAVESALMAR